MNNDAVEISDLAMVKESIELLVENGEAHWGGGMSCTWAVDGVAVHIFGGFLK